MLAIATSTKGRERKESTSCALRGRHDVGECHELTKTPPKAAGSHVCKIRQVFLELIGSVRLAREQLVKEM